MMPSGWFEPLDLLSGLCRTQSSGLPKDGEHHVRSSLLAPLLLPSSPACCDGSQEGRQRLFLKDMAFWVFL